VQGGAPTDFLDIDKPLLNGHEHSFKRYKIAGVSYLNAGSRDQERGTHSLAAFRSRDVEVAEKDNSRSRRITIRSSLLFEHGQRNPECPSRMSLKLLCRACWMRLFGNGVFAYPTAEKGILAVPLTNLDLLTINSTKRKETTVFLDMSVPRRRWSFRRRGSCAWRRKEHHDVPICAVFCQHLPKMS
jgi:hypothetical protein